jgi:hypothetical protein
MFELSIGYKKPNNKTLFQHPSIPHFSKTNVTVDFLYPHIMVIILNLITNEVDYDNVSLAVFYFNLYTSNWRF